LVLGDGRPAVSPHGQPAPIASLAKVMTAYLTLNRYPLSGAQDGFTITVTAAQAQAELEDAAEHQSVVAVQAGEQLTERELLEALLIPSGNNIAQVLAAQVAGSETRFIAEMNAEARALGMNPTTYTDPSGFDPNTVSTAADQLRVFQEAILAVAARHGNDVNAITTCRRTHDWKTTAADRPGPDRHGRPDQRVRFERIRRHRQQRRHQS
jgi:serine-type D-Ala-D-Ala carboxypeptidase (penicillin-binding protein 5/6)